MLSNVHARTALKAGVAACVMFLLATLPQSAIFMITHSIGLVLPVLLMQPHLGQTVLLGTAATSGCACGGFLGWVFVTLFSGGEVSGVHAVVFIAILTFLFGFINLEPLFNKFGCIYVVLVVVGSFNSTNSAPISFTAYLAYVLEVALSSCLSIIVDILILPKSAIHDFRNVFSDSLNELHTAWHMLLKGRSSKYRAAILARAQAMAQVHNLHPSKVDPVIEASAQEDVHLDTLLRTLNRTLNIAGSKITVLRELLNNARWEEWRHIVWYFTWPLLPTDSFSTSVSNRRLRHYQLALNELYSLHAHLCVMREALLAGCHESVHAQLIQPLELGGTLSHVEATVAHEFMACAFEFARHRSADTASYVLSHTETRESIQIISDETTTETETFNDESELLFAADTSLDLVLRPAQRELRRRSCVEALAKLERAVHHARLHSYTFMHACDHLPSTHHGHSRHASSVVDSNISNHESTHLIPAAAMSGAFWDIPTVNTYFLNLRASVLAILDIHAHLQACTETDEVPEFSTDEPDSVEEISEHKSKWRRRCSWCGDAAADRWAKYSEHEGRLHCVALLTHVLGLFWTKRAQWTSAIAAFCSPCCQNESADVAQSTVSISVNNKSTDSVQFDFEVEDRRTTALRKQCILGFKVAVATSIGSILITVPATLSLLSDKVIAFASSSSASTAFLTDLMNSLQSSAVWVVLTCALVMESSVGANFRKSLLRIFGTILGGVAGYLCNLLFPNDVGLLCLAIVVLIPLFTYFRHKASISYGATVAALTMLIILQTSNSDSNSSNNTLLVATRRVIMIIIGCILAILVNQFIWPQRARSEIDRLLACTMQRLSTVYRSSNLAFFSHLQASTPVATASPSRPRALSLGSAQVAANRLLNARHSWAEKVSQKLDDLEIECLPHARTLCFEATAEPSWGLFTSCCRSISCFASDSSVRPLRSVRFKSKPFLAVIDDLEKLLVWFKLFETCLDHNVEDVATLVRIEQVAPRGSDQAQPEAAVGLQHDALFALDVVESMQVALSRLRESSEGILEACATALLTLNNSSLVSMLELSRDHDGTSQPVSDEGVDFALLRMQQNLSDVVSSYERSMGTVMEDFSVASTSHSHSTTHVQAGLEPNHLFAASGSLLESSELHHLPSLNQSFTFSGLVFGSYQFCVDLRRLVSHTSDAIAVEVISVNC